MTKGVVAHGEGIVISSEVSDFHAIDQPGFENHVFTPYAAFDPGHGARYQRRTGPDMTVSNWTDIECDEYADAQTLLLEADFASGYRYRVGTAESPALIFKRKELRVTLLDKLAQGIELEDDEYHAVRPKSRAVDVFRVGTLQWKTQSANAWRDFAQYLQAECGLSRYVAWRLAWALVRSAYLESWETVGGLIRTARMPRSDRDMLPQHLDDAIGYLKTRALT